MSRAWLPLALTLPLALALSLLPLPVTGQDDAPPPPEPAIPDARTYVVTVEPTGEAALDEAVAAASRLVTLRERVPTDLPGILARARGDGERLRAALDSEGYFAGSSTIRVAGQDPAAPEFRPPPPGPVPVTVSIRPGPRYRIALIDARASDGREREADRAAAALQDLVGEPARGRNVVEAQDQVIERLLVAGHPFARVAERDVLVDHDREAMEIRFALAPGPVADFAASSVDGTERVDPRFLRNFTDRLLEGQRYSPERVSRARAEITALGVFDSVRLDTGDALDAAGDLPVSLTVAERLRRAVGFNAAFETRYGATLGAFFEHRNTFGNAERVRVEATGTRLGGGNVENTGARLALNFRDPFAFNLPFTFNGTLAVLRERLRSYDRDAVTGSFLFERRLSDRLTLNTGPVFEVGRSGPRGGELEPNQVAGWQFGARWDGTDSLLDPRRGIRAEATITPSYSFREGNPYAVVRLSASTYFDVGGAGRSILALRAGYGQLLGTAAADVPITQRFFAGGGGSVRGYDFQVISPRDPRTGGRTGGANLAELSAEWRQRFGDNWGAVAFLDGGRVGGGGRQGDDAAWRLGAGVGARYYTAIGPIRADVAVPLVRQRGSQGWGLYIGIGQSF